MNRRIRRLGIGVHRLILLAVALVFTDAAATAQQSTEFDVRWHTVDGGGGTMQGGEFELHVTVGQPEAATPLIGSEFELLSGYWAGVAVTNVGAGNLVFRDSFE